MQTAGASPPRSALLAAWTNAWLAGEVSLPEAVQRVSALDDQHTVAGLWVDDLPLEQAIGRLRADGVLRVRVVLPVPGDVLGLPGPGPFTTGAVAAAEGALALREDGTATGLVPTVTAHGSSYDGTVTTVVWSAHEVVVGPQDPGPFLPDAEHDLRLGVLECARVLRDLDGARWRPELADALADLRRQARAGIDEDELPGSYPVRAREVLARARQLAGVLELAVGDQGGSVTTQEAVDRERALRELGHLVRRARVAAYNAHGLR